MTKVSQSSPPNSARLRAGKSVVRCSVATKIIRQTRLEDGSEVTLLLKDSACWQGFILTGLPKEHHKHETGSHSLSSAVTIWNRVVDVADHLSVKEVSAKIHNGGLKH